MKTVIKKTLNKLWKLCRLPSLRKKKEEVPWCAGYLEKYGIQSTIESGHVVFVAGPPDGGFVPTLGGNRNKVLLLKENSYV